MVDFSLGRKALSTVLYLKKDAEAKFLIRRVDKDFVVEDKIILSFSTDMIEDTIVEAEIVNGVAEFFLTIKQVNDLISMEVDSVRLFVTTDDFKDLWAYGPVEITG